MPSVDNRSEDQPLRVAECSGCRQLFVVYATDGLIACPGCSTTTTVASLEIAELGVATPIAPEVPEPVAEIATEAPSLASSLASSFGLPEPPKATVPAAMVPAAAEVEPAPTAEEVANEVAEDTSRPPTVAEWLMRSDAPAPPPEPEPEPAEEPPAPKRSLSESLGWNPGGFQLEGLSPAETPSRDTAPAPSVEADVPREPTAKPLEEFRFDFGGSPLAEQPAATPTPDAETSVVASTPSEAAVSLELSTSSAAADPEPNDFAELLSATAETKERRSWSGPISAAAGLLLIAAPAAYLAFTWPSDGELADASAEIGRRLTAEPTVAGTDAGAAALPSSDTAAPTPPINESRDEPILDPATRPASFEAPPTNLPPNPYPANQPIETPADPFMEPAAAPLPGTQPPAAAGDRYASMQVESEPEEFTLPEDDFAPMETTQEPTALAPVERTPRPIVEAPPTVGLLNAPRYSAEKLNEALEQAALASRGFSEGTLADPAQVSTMGQHYARLCYLAQVLTLLDPAEKRGGLLTAELEAADTFKRLFREAGPRAESKQIAAQWIGWTGRPHGGVFFAGTPLEMNAAGETIQYLFRLGEVEVPVIMSERINVDRFINASATEVGVIGVVVENPRQWIAGYTGNAERVVWARKTLPLKRAQEPL